MLTMLESSAVIDGTGQYRYVLRRRWAPGKTALVTMLNPSTADGSENDPTVIRVINFCKMLGYGAVIIVNLFAFRATDPKIIEALCKYDGDAIGPENDYYIQEAAEECEVVIAAWGANKVTGGWSMNGRAYSVCRLLSRYQIQCLRITKSGQPEHPLYLPSNLTLIPLNPHMRAQDALQRK